MMATPRYGVGWRVLYSNDPGKVLYEDDVQIVVTLIRVVTNWTADSATDRQR